MNLETFLKKAMKPSILQKIKKYKIKEIHTLNDTIGLAFFDKE